MDGRTAPRSRAPNDVEVVFSCPPTVSDRTGRSTLIVRDVMGNTGRVDRLVPVLAAP